MKRNLIILLFIVLAAVAGFFYFNKNESIFSKETYMYKAIPASVPVFVELNSLRSVPVNNPIIKELINTEKDVLFLSKVARMDSLIQSRKEIQHNLRNESLILAFEFVGEKDVYPLVIAKAESKNKQKSFIQLLEVLFPVNDFNYVEEEYSGRKITTISTKQNEIALHICFTEGLFLASPKVLLVEQSIRQLGAQSIVTNMFFAKVNKTVTAQSKISWYINHQTFPDLVALWLNSNTTKSTNEFGVTVRNNYKNSFNSFRSFAAWSELDVELNKNEILFNGISSADDSLKHFLSVFDGQEPVRFQAEELLPKNTSFFTSYTFSDRSLFFQNLENYFSHMGSYYKREDQIKKIESGFRVDFKSNFQQIVKNELIVATTSIPTETANKTTLFVIQTTGKTNAESQLNKFLSTYSKRKKVELEKLKSTFEVDSETKFTIYKFPYPSFPGIWLGKPFTTVQAKFAAFYENALVFSNSEKGLNDYLYNMVLESSLSKDVRYMKFKQNLASRTNINSYANVNRIYAMNKEVFNENISRDFENMEEVLRKFYAVNWQVICENEVSFNSVKLAYNQSSEEEAHTTWQSNIGNQINKKPQIVINHRDVNNKEVVVQDSENNLHQITKDGRVRWSVAIPEAIMGEIHQVDYFGNGRLQYLFNTKSKLYLIDRDGNNVAHFPVKFRSPATNGVSVFDYDNNRKYRYFVAFEDKKVVALDSDGKILTGWKFGKTDYSVTTPIQHFRVNNKDYIVFKDQSRIYIQNRRGETRVKTTAKFENSKNPLVLNLNGTPKIVATDKSGKVFYIYFNGKFAEKETAKFSANHFFTVDDINGNGVPDFVFVDGKELSVMDENGKKLFSEKFRNKIQHQPNIYSFSSKVKKIGIVESSANRIHLFDPNGKLHEGFPLQGNSEYSIGEISKNSGQLNLIVGSKGEDLYNYTLNQ